MDISRVFTLLIDDVKEGELCLGPSHLIIQSVPTSCYVEMLLCYALEPRACVGSVTRQTRRQFCRDIFLICLTDQTNIACFMIIRGV